MKNYEAEKLRKIIKAKEDAMIIQIKETDELRKELNRLKSSLLYSEDDMVNYSDYCWKQSNYNRNIAPLSPREWKSMINKLK